jgi:cytochrome c oxidase assembly protein subunit 15
MAETAPAVQSRTAALVAGFGATVAMWAFGYVAHLPAVQAPRPVLFGVLVVCLGFGGFMAGRWTGRAAVGVGAGLVSALVNLLVLGSVMTNALMEIPGYLVLGGILGALGGLVGSRFSPPQRPPYGPEHMALIAALATLLLVGAGGLVTTQGAGMAVPDWPGTFGEMMFVFPLSRMTGGIYYEHAHRLFGTLVGLTSLVIACYYLRAESRAWVRTLAFGILLLVIVQGLAGGLRVTENSLPLAAAHGVVGQAIFALFVALAAITSSAFRGPTPPTRTPRAVIEWRIGAAMVVLLLVQIALGTLYRHFGKMLHAHITGAVLVFGITMVGGFRAWGLYPDLAPIRRTGVAILVVTAIQLVLGFVALWGRSAWPDLAARPPEAMLLITAHQFTGALLLAAVALHYTWTRRLLAPE